MSPKKLSFNKAASQGQCSVPAPDVAEDVQFPCPAINSPLDHILCSYPQETTYFYIRFIFQASQLKGLSIACMTTEIKLDVVF